MKRRDVVTTSKLIHFYKYESEISLEQGRSFIVNKRGQIQELNLDMINSKNKDENLSFYLKNIEKLMNIQRKSTNNSSMMRKFIRRKTTMAS